MKLLFDQNISARIVTKLYDIFPDCSQVRLDGLEKVIRFYSKKISEFLISESMHDMSCLEIR